MKKTITLLMLAAMAVGSLSAGNVSQQMAQRVGKQFLSTTVLGQERAGFELKLVSAAVARGGVDYYVFNVSGGNGFVIIAGDDRVKPVLAYSTTGSFDPEDVAEGFAFTLNNYRTEIQYVREHNLSATPDIVAEWNSVLNTGNLRSGRVARAVVGPLCQTIWNQNFPWNSQCPEDEEGNGGHVYAGCVATAMGQVMKFYDYPEHGTGSHTYNPDGYAQQTANFGETDYHFELMPLALDSTNTEEEYFYVAQFLHHCGIAVDMQYSGHGSGAYSFDVPVALQNYFGYSCDNLISNYNYWPGMGYSNEEWGNMLKEEGGLDENIPLYYSGSDDGGAGGHAFVCDGYDENNYFHFNWGWSGRDDAWCPIGALNTTKYAFNMSNAFIGHIIPNDGSYFNRPDSVSFFTVTENETMDGVLLSWYNPSANLYGINLGTIQSVTIRRNNQVIATLTDVTAGDYMTYADEGLEPGLYEYAIFVTCASGISRNVYRKILVGEKCDVVFELHDDGGNGWKGAAISVTAENGQRIAVITMPEGSEQTVVVPLLSQNLNFIWNHGWYHLTEEYDTDYECSFIIRDADENELYVSGELEDGVFLNYSCDLPHVDCYPVRNLQGEEQWHNSEEYGVYLTWDKPSVTTRLDYFIVYRSTESYQDFVIGTIPFNGDDSFEFFDNLVGREPEDTYYSVACVCITSDGGSCQSEHVEVLIHVTDVVENSAEARIYPNPTTGLINIESQGVMRITVSNLLGQQMLETEAEGKSSIDLSCFGQGVYMLRIQTATGVTVQKVSVRK